MKVDLGCGNNKKEGFTGLDITKEGTQADIAHDLNIFPWPFESNTVDEFYSSHNFEHIDQDKRGPHMEEAYRCLKPGGLYEIVTPYAWSHRSIQDFTHKWPPIVMESYFYFDAKWRKQNGLTHWMYDLKCDFEIAGCNYMLMDEEAFKEEKEKRLRMTNNINTVADMVIVLKKRMI